MVMGSDTPLWRMKLTWIFAVITIFGPCEKGKSFQTRKHNKSMINERSRALLASVLLSIAVLTVYFNVQYFEFVNYDDPPYVTANQIVKSGLTWKGFAWALTTMYYANWHPLTWISYMLDYEIFGLRAGGYHLTNLLLHILNSIMIFYVFKRMTDKFWQSFTVAALFALHPLHVESVAWISARKDVLSTFFWFSTIYAYLLYIERPVILRYIFVMLSFAIGLTAKPMLVTLPFVLVLLDYWPLRRFDFGLTARSMIKLLLEKVPLMTLSIVSSIITFLAQSESQATASLDLLSLEARISNALLSYAKYVLKMLLPVDLAVLYPHPGFISIEHLIASAVLIVAITISVIYFSRHHPYLSTGWFWYLGTLIPVIGIVQAGSQAMADRYTYIPLIGLFIMIAWGVPDLLKGGHFKKIVIYTSAITISTALLITSWLQVQVWENSVTLFQHAIKVTSQNSIAHNNLAIALARQGKTGEAVWHYNEALRISPSYSDAHNNLGALLARNGNFEAAIKEFQAALRTDSHHELAKSNLKKVLEIQSKK